MTIYVVSGAGTGTADKLGLTSITAIAPSGDTTGATDVAAINSALVTGDVLLNGIFYTADEIKVPSGRTLHLWDAEVNRVTGGTGARVIVNKSLSDAGSGNVMSRDANVAVIGRGRAIVRVTNPAGFTRGATPLWYFIGLMFVNCDGVRVSGVQVGPTQAFASCVQGCTKVRYREIELNQDSSSANQDGLDTGPGCSDVVYDGVTGTTGDDVFSLFAHQQAASMHPALNNTNSPTADIIGVTIRNVSVNPGVNLIRANAGDGRSLKRVDIDNIRSTRTSSGGAILQIGESIYVTTLPTTAQFTGIHMTNVRPGRQRLLNLDNTCSDILIDGVICDSLVPQLIGKNASVSLTHNNIAILNVEAGDPAVTSSVPDLVSVAQGTITGLTLRNWRIIRCQRLLNNAATVTECDISDISISTLGSATAGSVIASTTAETGTIHNVAVAALAGAATGRYVGAAVKLRMGANMPIFDTADTTPAATTKGSRALATAAKQLDGGAGTTGAEWIADGTVWKKAADLGTGF